MFRVLIQHRERVSTELLSTRFVAVERSLNFSTPKNVLTTSTQFFSSAAPRNAFNANEFKSWVGDKKKSDTTASASVSEDSQLVDPEDVHLIDRFKELAAQNHYPGTWNELYRNWKISTTQARNLSTSIHVHTLKNSIDHQLIDSLNLESSKRGRMASFLERKRLTEWEDVNEIPKFNKKAVHYIGKEFTGAANPPGLKPEYQRTINMKGPNFLFDYLGTDKKTETFQAREKNLRHIYQPNEISWDNIPPFVISSRDPTMRALSSIFSPRFTSSTSSFTGLLGMLHLAITRSSITNSAQLGTWTKDVTKRFTKSTLRPVSVILRRRGEDRWGCDAFPSGDPKPNDILIDLGKSLELQLTTTNDQFVNTYLSDEALAKHKVSRDTSHIEHVDFNSHQYMTFGNILLRSQLDCVDTNSSGERLVFDLKTRATVPIRYDVSNFQKYLDYKVIAEKGMLLSTEREKYDMIRSAYLKYMLQCKIGNMNGILVAYHNTAEMFALEYIKVEEMCQSLFGSPHIGEFLFHQSLSIANDLLAKIVAIHGANDQTQAIRVTMSPVIPSRDASSISGLDIIVEVLDQATESDEEYLCDRHIGPMHVDRMTPEGVSAALKRRGIPVKEVDSHNRAQLEAYVCPPSGALVLNHEYALERARSGNVFFYNFDTTATLDDRPANVKELTPEQVGQVTLKTSLRSLSSGDWIAPHYMNIYNAYHSSDSSTPALPVRAEVMQDDVNLNILSIYDTYYNSAKEITKPIISSADELLENSPEKLQNPGLALRFPEKVEEMLNERLSFDPLEKFSSVKEAVDFMFVAVSNYADDIKREYEKDIGPLRSALRTSDQFSRAVLDASEVAQLLIKKMHKDKISEKHNLQLQSTPKTEEASTKSAKLKNRGKVRLGNNEKTNILHVLSSSHVMNIAQAITNSTGAKKSSQEHCADLIRKIQSDQKKYQKRRQAKAESRKEGTSDATDATSNATVDTTSN